MPTTVISHPVHFKTGFRILMIKGRHKDGVEKLRAVTRISESRDKYNKILVDLLSQLVPGERIYASANERDLKKAARMFRQNQLEASYDKDPEIFYRNLQARWVSCLMKSPLREGKLYMFDIDEPNEQERREVLINICLSMPKVNGHKYTYPTKNGGHLLLPAFNRKLIEPEHKHMFHPDPLILVAY